MKKLFIVLLFCPCIYATPENWIEHTYHNESDNPIKIVTYYTQAIQHFVQPKKRRKVTSEYIEHSVATTLEPQESKTIILKGDPLSARKVVPGNIKVFDICKHNRAIVPKHNVHNRTDFIVSRNKRGRLEIHPQR